MTEKQEFDIKPIDHKDFVKVTGSSIVVRDRRITADGLLHDLNTPELLASISKLINEGAKGSRTTSIAIEDLKVLFYLDHYILKLGLFEQDNDATTHGIPEDIRLLAEQRRQAKQEKNWQRADELRDKLHELGRIMKDGKDGYDLVKE